MDWLDKMNCALDYIEENLSEDIDFAIIAQKACCSSYNFQRMFSFIANIPLAVYIRQRRMTIAAQELQNSDVKVIDLAVKYGYDSPISFARAFQVIHGVTPSSARNEGVTLKSHSKISFQISIKGDISMDYRIEKKKAFNIVGAKFPVPSDMDENFKIVPGIWRKAEEEGMVSEIAKICDVDETKVISLSANIAEEICDFYIAIESDIKDFPEKFCSIEIPSATWAVFISKGEMPMASQNMWRRIFTEWLPDSEYEITDKPEFERYLYNENSKDLCGCEIWIPVVKRQS